MAGLVCAAMGATLLLLAGAGAGKGLHTAVFNATLDFEVPASTQPAAYSATLTVTAMP